MKKKKKKKKKKKSQFYVYVPCSSFEAPSDKTNLIQIGWEMKKHFLMILNKFA